MDKIPFSIYDFFGYLSAGSLALFGAAYAYEGVDAFDVDFTMAQILLLVVASYVAGHAIAGVSSFVLERRLTRRFLGSPTGHLFDDEQPAGWRRLFGQYHASLPAKTQELILDKAKKRAGIDGPGEALFLHCFGVVRHEEYPRLRLATFLNLYGFSRNTSMSSLLVGLGLVAAAVMETGVAVNELLTGAFVAVLVSVVMYFRYLKFYRQYAFELYVTYADASE